MLGRWLRGKSSADWFNEGLDAKHARQWTESLRCNQHAVKLDQGNDGAWWNLGIAATALHEWREAHQAWRYFGIEIPEGDGEWSDLAQSACVRLDPDGAAEVVWGNRLDPARMKIINVPLPESARRFGDIVLHDGAPAGTRVSQGQEYPVFNELALWQESTFGTFRVEVGANADTEKLIAICHDRGLGAEDWTTMRWLCERCSLGNPGPHQCTAQDHAPNGQRQWAVAARSETELLEALAAWGGRYLRFDPLITPPPGRP